MQYGWLAATFSNAGVCIRHGETLLAQPLTVISSTELVHQMCVLEIERNEKNEQPKIWRACDVSRSQAKYRIVPYLRSIDR